MKTSIGTTTLNKSFPPVLDDKPVPTF